MKIIILDKVLHRIMLLTVIFLSKSKEISSALYAFGCHFLSDQSTCVIDQLAMPCGSTFWKNSQNDSRSWACKKTDKKRAWLWDSTLLSSMCWHEKKWASSARLHSNSDLPYLAETANQILASENNWWNLRSQMKIGNANQLLYLRKIFSKNRQKARARY